MGSVESYIAHAPAYNVDRATLTELASHCGRGKRTVLLGLNEYSKHLVNLFGAEIVCILEIRPEYHGVSFRGVVVRPVEWVDCDQYIACDFASLQIYKRVLYPRCFVERVPFHFAWSYAGQPAGVVLPVLQDALYQKVFDPALRRPTTMQSQDALFFMLELLQSTMNCDGDVAEVGAWQGGSAWYLAKMLELKHSQKHLFTFEMGEELKATDPQGVVCHDQMVRDLAFYPRTSCFFGEVTRSFSSVEDRVFSFVFLDFGFPGREVLEFFWDRMPIGAVFLFDNYGLTLGHSELFDRFFEESNTHVVRLPRSPVAFVHKS